MADRSKQLSSSSTTMEDLSEQLSRIRIKMAPVSEDLIEEIFTRLPAKSLLRFKTVSKNWCFVISSDSEFAKRHLKQSSSPSKGIFFDLDPSDKAILYQSSDVRTHKFNFPRIIPKPCRVLGSDNGLVCIAPLYGKGCFLWNPLINYCKIMAPTVNFCSCRLSGFFYDAHADDYKIVGVWTSHFGVFSLKNNSWTKHEHSIRLRSFTTTPMFSNGALHWCVGPIIVAFDLAKEQLFKLEIPFSLRSDRLDPYSILFDHKGCLCLSDGCSFWVMEEYGNADSWFEFDSERVKLPAWISRVINKQSTTVKLTGFIHTESLISPNISVPK